MRLSGQRSNREMLLLSAIVLVAIVIVGYLLVTGLI